MSQAYRETCVELCSNIVSSFLAVAPQSVPKRFGNEPPCQMDIWIRRITSYGNLDAFISLVAVFYLFKIHQLNPQLRFSKVNAHRCFLVAAILASKYSEDRTYLNNDWATIGFSYYPVSLLNQMEIEMLKLLNFELSFKMKELSEFLEFQLQTIEKLNPELVDNFRELDRLHDNLLCTDYCTLL
ncbi:hypothetical protein GEMRC1_001908 [Eukaryota sp. GEM-RC1]